MNNSERNSSIYNALKRLWPHISNRRRTQLTFVFIMMVLASLAEVISIGTVLPFLGALTNPETIFEKGYLQPLINWLRLDEPKDLLLPLTIIFVSAVIFSGCMRLTLLWCQTRLGHAIGADFSIGIYRTTLYQPYSVHISRNSSEIISGISSKANGLVYGTVIPIITIGCAIFMLATILWALIIIEPMVPIAIIAGFGTIYALVTLATKAHLAKNSRIISKERNRVIKALQEGLNGIRDVLLDGSQEVHCTKYLNSDLPLRRAQANVEIISISPRYIIEALGMVLIALMAFSLAMTDRGIVNAIPVLGAMVLGAQRILPMLQQIYSSLAHIQGGHEPLLDSLELLEQPLPESAFTEKTKNIVFQDAIELSDLHFKYREDLPYVLQNINLKISKGSSIGLIGETGSGKSTLLDVIMGFLKTSEGTIFVDKKAILENNSRNWQANLAHVPQAIFLADSSIAENIALGILPQKIDQKLLRQVAQDAQLLETIENLEKKFDTLVGENGVRLSGGQRQRVGIARALYKQASVIVFDEATSALDTATEKKLITAINNLREKPTLMMVAHRLSTLKNCDQIIELKNGTINRIGTYTEIIGPHPKGN